MAHDGVGACAVRLAGWACSEAISGFGAEGRGGDSPWEQLRGQIYLGSDAFVAAHPSTESCDPRNSAPSDPGPAAVTAHAVSAHGDQIRGIRDAYRQYGYRLTEIAAHLGVHDSTVSRRLKQIEQAHA
jgi:DNA-binding NtrC family response regulator